MPLGGLSLSELNSGCILLNATGAAVSVTGTVSETALVTIPLSVGMMGPNSWLWIEPSWSYTNSVNNKTLAIKYGATLGGAATIYTRTRTTSAGESPLVVLANRGAANSQTTPYSALGNYGTAIAAAPGTLSIDFTVAGNLYVTGTLANTGETITLESLLVNIFNPGAAS